MQYQYQPFYQNQPQYSPNYYPHPQYHQHPHYGHFSNLRQQYYDPARFSQYHYAHQQHHLHPHSFQQTTGYLPSQHNVSATYQRQSELSHFPRGPSVSQGQINAPIHQVVYEQQQLNPPESIRQVQYIPYQKRYIDYVAQKVQIPVQKYTTQYYQIQHVVDFVPRQYQDTVVQMVPEQVIRYRLQYVPVQKKIIHMGKEDVVNFQKNAIYGQKIQPLPISSIQHQNLNKTIHKQVSRVIPAQSTQNRVNMEGSRVSNKSNLSRRSRKTNYVTADNYNPSYREEQLYQQSRVVNKQAIYNIIDDRFMKKQTQKQYRNTKLSQSSGSRGFR